jgi:hypothetical protein
MVRDAALGCSFSRLEEIDSRPSLLSLSLEALDVNGTGLGQQDE